MRDSRMCSLLHGHFLQVPPFGSSTHHMGVDPKIVGKPPKWMVKIMENPIKMDDFGGKNPYFWVDTYICTQLPKFDVLKARFATEGEGDGQVRVHHP